MQSSPHCTVHVQYTVCSRVVQQRYSLLYTSVFCVVLLNNGARRCELKLRCYCYAPLGTIFLRMLQNAGDFIGKSAKYAFVLGSVGVIIAVEAWEPLYYLVGAITNAVLSKLLKIIIRQPRPPLSPKASYGMPSSHAQSMCYFLAVIPTRLPQDCGLPFTAAVFVFVALYTVVSRYNE